MEGLLDRSWAFVQQLLTGDFANVARAFAVLVIGFVLSRLTARLVGRLAGRALPRHQVMLLRRGVHYTLVVLIFLWFLRELGFDLTVLLGAAGILTVAFGFASQTSASNLVSGLFLLAEQSFVPGDVITIGETTGEVLSVDLLSVKIRTFDNLFVRVPNEAVLKAQVINRSRFPIRRVDLPLAIQQSEDIGRVRKILTDLAADHELVFEEPKPELFFEGFREDLIHLRFAVWTERGNFITVRNQLGERMRERLVAEGVELPHPLRLSRDAVIDKPAPILA